MTITLFLFRIPRSVFIKHEKWICLFDRRRWTAAPLITLQFSSWHNNYSYTGRAEKEYWSCFPNQLRFSNKFLSTDYFQTLRLSNILFETKYIHASAKVNWRWEKVMNKSWEWNDKKIITLENAKSELVFL